jgi:hypothetical protein
MELARGAIGAAEIDIYEPYILVDPESSPMRRIVACDDMSRSAADLGTDNRRHLLSI